MQNKTKNSKENVKGNLGAAQNGFPARSGVHRSTTGSGARKRVERLFRIVSLLENAAATGKKLNAKQLGKELEVERATVFRDIELLRDMNMGVDWDSVDQTYYLNGNQKFMPAMELTEMDKLALEFFTQVLGGLGESELGRKMQESGKRLVGIFTGKSLKSGGGMPVTVDSSTVEKSASQLKVFYLAQRAMRSGVLLEVQTLWNGVGEKKMIRPNGLYIEQGKWTLHGMEGSLAVHLDFSSILHVALVTGATEPSWHPSELKAA